MKYLLRDIPDGLWVRAKRRAIREGRSLRFVLVQLLGLYASQGLPDGRDGDTLLDRPNAAHRGAGRSRRSF